MPYKLSIGERMLLAGSVGALTVLATMGGAAVASADGTNSSTVYSSLVSRSGTLPSVGAEAYAFNEFGNEVTSRRHPPPTHQRYLEQLAATGHRTATTATRPPAPPSVPITLNIYNPPTTGSPLPGSLITRSRRPSQFPTAPPRTTPCVTS